MSLSILSIAELNFLINNNATPSDFLFLSFRFFLKILKPGISMESVADVRHQTGINHTSLLSLLAKKLS